MDKNISKKLKVYESNAYNKRDVPKILLQGQWLERAGFEVGGRIQVYVKEKSMVIRKIIIHK